MKLISRNHWSNQIEIDWESIIGFTLLFLLIAFVVWMFTMMFLDLNLQSSCLQNGYPEHSLTLKAVGYCIRTINQTQYVVPVSEILK